MTKTTYLDSVALSIGSLLAAVENQALANSASLTAATDVASVTAASTRFSAFAWAAETGWPNSADWPAASAGDPYKVVISVSAIGADLSLEGGAPGSYVAQFSSDLATRIATTSGGSWDSTTGTGIKTFTDTSEDLGGDVGYRAGFHLAVTNAATMKSEDITLNLGTTATYLQGPWTDAATLSPPFRSKSIHNALVR